MPIEAGKPGDEARIIYIIKHINRHWYPRFTNSCSATQVSAHAFSETIYIAPRPLTLVLMLNSLTGLERHRNKTGARTLHPQTYLVLSLVWSENSFTGKALITAERKQSRHIDVQWLQYKGSQANGPFSSGGQKWALTGVIHGNMHVIVLSYTHLQENMYVSM